MKSIIAGFLLFTGFQCALSGRAAAQVGSACTSWVGNGTILGGAPAVPEDLTAKSKVLGWSIAR